MNITISLPPEQQPELERQAAAAGTDVASFVAGIVRRELVKQGLDEQSPPAAAADAPYDEWSAQFQSWVASQKSRNPAFDDSRQGIYD